MSLADKNGDGVIDLYEFLIGESDGKLSTVREVGEAMELLAEDMCENPNEVDLNHNYGSGTTFVQLLIKRKARLDG